MYSKNYLHPLMIFSFISHEIKKKVAYTIHNKTYRGRGFLREIFVHWTQVGTNFHIFKKNQYQLEVKVQLLLSS